MGTINATVVVLWTALGLTPTEDANCERVDLVEVNHFFDEQGKLVLDQLIFYDWSPVAGRFQVRAWRLLKKPAQLPRKDWREGDYVALWSDGQVLRKVYSKQFRETWTQYDPELIEREYLPKDKRRDLRKTSALKWQKPPEVAPPAETIVGTEYRAP